VRQDKDLHASIDREELVSLVLETLGKIEGPPYIFSVVADS